VSFFAADFASSELPQPIESYFNDISFKKLNGWFYKIGNFIILAKIEISRKLDKIYSWNNNIKMKIYKN
jgi:hypothetical protein